MPGPESEARIADALSANADATVKLYPLGDHPVFENATGYERNIPNVTQYAEDYLADLDAFLKRMAR